jgi:hypothetical protein
MDSSSLFCLLRFSAIPSCRATHPPDGSNPGPWLVITLSSYRCEHSAFRSSAVRQTFAITRINWPRYDVGVVSARQALPAVLRVRQMNTGIPILLINRLEFDLLRIRVQRSIN